MKINVNVKIRASKSLIQLVSMLVAGLSGQLPAAVAEAPKFEPDCADLKKAPTAVNIVFPSTENVNPTPSAPPVKRTRNMTKVTAPVETPTPEPTPEAPVTAEQAIEEEEQGAGTTEAGNTDGSTVESATYTVEQVRATLTELMGADNAKKLKARDILISFGVKSVSEMAPADYAAFVEKAKTELK